MNENLLSATTYIILNETEASLLTGIDVKGEQSARMASQRLIEKGINTVIITLDNKAVSFMTGLMKVN